MSNLEKPVEIKSLLDEAKGVIERAKAGIEDEFSRTENTWLECFGSRVFALETYLTLKRAEKEFGSEKHKEILVRLEELKQRLYDLKSNYPQKDNMPPENLKAELLAALSKIIE